MVEHYTPVPQRERMYGDVEKQMHFPTTPDEWATDRWQRFATQKDPSTPWLRPRTKQLIDNFELVVSSRWPTVQDIRLPRWGRWVLKTLSQLALPAGNLRRAVGIEMGAADDRPAQAQGGEPVSGISQPTMPTGNGLELPVRTSDGPSSVSAAEGYERWAPSYDRTPNPLLAREERYLVPLLPDLHDKHVLDLACGTGRWLERLLARGAHLGVGVDFSIAMLGIARRKVTLTGRLARADCLRLPFRTSVFDLAVCSFA